MVAISAPGAGSSQPRDKQKPRCAAETASNGALERQSIGVSRSQRQRHGRVFGVYVAIGAGTFPLGILTYGFLLDALSLAPTLLLFAVANTALPLTLLAMPTLRDMRRPDRTVEPSRVDSAAG